MWSGRHRFATPAPLVTLVMIVATTLTLAADGPPPRPPQLSRAMWLWDQAPAAEVVAWSRTHDVDEIFVGLPALVGGTDLAYATRLKRLADPAGIRLSALGGEPGWTFDHAAAVTWQRAALATGLFDRAHVDVEPYLLPEWDTDPSGVVAAYVALLAVLSDDAPEVLELDVPAWYDTVPVGDHTLADEVLHHAAAVTVMSYRDTVTGPNSLMSISRDMLLRANRAGKPLRLGVETAPSAECPHCTFHGSDQETLAAALATVDIHARRYASYRGTAVHHYRSWRELHRVR